MLPAGHVERVAGVKVTGAHEPTQHARAHQLLHGRDIGGVSINSFPWGLAQLTFRESLRDIETCLRAHSSKFYHLGICGRIARSTLADANEKRDWRIYRDFALSLIQVARKLSSGDPFGLSKKNSRSP